MIRKGLVVFQFTISIFLIAGTLIIKNQLDFIQDKRLGYDTEHILSLPMTESFSQRLSEGQLQPDQQKIITFKQQFSKIPGIRHVSTAYDTPNGYLTSEVEYQDESYSITSLPVDFDYLKTMDLKLDSGRDFEIGRSTDSTKAIIINKTAARLFNLENKIGETLNIKLGPQSPQLIGIVEDFHTASFHHSIGPAILQIQPIYYDSYILRVEKGSLPNVLSQLEATWKNLAPMHPFSYSFLDDELQEMYESEQRLGNMFSTFSLIAILIACLGLLGLSAFMIKQKTKEIGIRKVLGASIADIVALLSKDFVKLVILGFVISIPIAWYAMNQWLADFAYRIEIGPGIFALAGGAALVIALLTVSWQSIKAALANPVDSLRSE